MVQCAVSATDILDQLRTDLMRGRPVGPINGVEVDAVFINHGDIVLPFEWPAAQGRLLVREGRILAGKHSVVTVHEVRDPYVVRVVAYDLDFGREFVLYLNNRDVLLLLDTHDAETSRGMDMPVIHTFLEGPCARQFREANALDGPLLDVVMGSLSFSVWDSQQIL